MRLEPTIIMFPLKNMTIQNPMMILSQAIFMFLALTRYSHAQPASYWSYIQKNWSHEWES